MFQFPSVYSDTRRRALAYTLERFQTDEYGPLPLFVFGDFNFRADTQGVVKVYRQSYYKYSFTLTKHLFTYIL